MTKLLKTFDFFRRRGLNCLYNSKKGLYTFCAKTFFGGAFEICPTGTVVTSAHSSQSVARICRVTATPYCSLHLPLAALATVPLLPGPGARVQIV